MRSFNSALIWQVINNAYKILKNSESRAAYDKKRLHGKVGDSAQVKSPNKVSSGPTRQQESANDLNFTDDSSSSETLTDVISDLFNEVMSGRGKDIFTDFVEFLESTQPQNTEYSSSYVENSSERVEMLRNLIRRLQVNFVSKCRHRYA